MLFQLINVRHQDCCVDAHVKVETRQHDLLSASFVSRSAARDDDVAACSRYARGRHRNIQLGKLSVPGHIDHFVLRHR